MYSTTSRPRLLTVSALLVATAGALLGSTPPAQAADKCVDVRVVSVRGSGEQGAPVGNTSRAIFDALSPLAPAGIRATATGIDYAAVGMDLAGLAKTGGTLGYRYQSSKSGGVRNLKRYLDAQEYCRARGERWVLIGYSQGAHVVGDAVSKADGALTKAQRSSVAALVLIADPRFNSREGFVYGSYRRGRNGLAGARAPGDLGNLESRTHSWCDTRDPICQGLAGGWDASVHAGTRYVSTYRNAIIDFLVTRLGWRKPPSPSSPATTTWTATATNPEGNVPIVVTGQMTLSSGVLQDGQTVAMKVSITETSPNSGAGWCYQTETLDNFGLAVLVNGESWTGTIPDANQRAYFTPLGRGYISCQSNGQPGSTLTFEGNAVYHLRGDPRQTGPIAVVYGYDNEDLTGVLTWRYDVRGDSVAS